MSVESATLESVRNALEKHKDNPAFDPLRALFTGKAEEICHCDMCINIIIPLLYPLLAPVPSAGTG